MNKIILDNKRVISQTNNKVKMIYQESEHDLEIPYIFIETTDKTDLLLDLNFDKAKLIIDFKVGYDINLYILCHSNDAKIKYHFNIYNGSKCKVVKYNQVNHINEMTIVDLNDEYSEVNYLFKSICNNLENYDYIVNHNYKNTTSNIINNGVNKNGGMNIQISGYIPNDITGCVCNQNNRIINLTNNKCEIRPNLYIDCDDVDANHSALIGKFSDEELFYLNSRGINDIDANNLLIKGFLLNGITNNEINKEIIKDIDKYWR